MTLIPPIAPGGVAPNSQAVVDHLTSLAQTHRAKVTLISSTSTEGRPLRAILVTDPSVPARDKQHAMIVAGRHGNEESGRLIALALADWLLSATGRMILKHHVVAILPDVNPDACVRDVYRHPSGPDVGGDLDEPTALSESRFIDDIAQRLQPELLIDLHACGHVGCTHDMALFPEPRFYTEDDNLFHEVAAQMCEAGEAAGVPHLSHPMRWWDSVDKGICARYYRQMKSLAILTETAESNGPCHSAALRIRSGLAKIQVALALGSRRHPKLHHVGYPNQLVIGSYHLGLVAWGKTAAQRRSSRVAIWRNADHVATLGATEMPTEDRIKRVRLEYRGDDLSDTVAVQILVRHSTTPTSVALGGKILRPSSVNGYTTWRHRRMTYVAVAIPRLSRGIYDIELRF